MCYLRCTHYMGDMCGGRMWTNHCSTAEVGFYRNVYCPAVIYTLVTISCFGNVANPRRASCFRKQCPIAQVASVLMKPSNLRSRNSPILLKGMGAKCPQISSGNFGIDLSNLSLHVP